MSTFGSFNTVRLGIYAAQKGLDVTGNNITNINTTGYTRQRLDQVSLMSSAADRYSSTYKIRIGQGAVVTSVSQIRDPALDISYRKAQTDLSATDQWLAGLQKIATVLDEVGKGDGTQDDGVILNQLNDLRDLINTANTNGIEGYDSLIRGSAKALCQLFNQYAKALDEKEQEFVTELDQQVTEVNDLLKGIQQLNVQIRNSDIRGDDGLELRDQRNLMLDELSKYMKIDVKYSMEDIGAGQKVEKLTVKLASQADPPHDHTLVDGEFAAEIAQVGSPPTVAGAPDYGIYLSDLVDTNGNVIQGNAMTLVDNDIHGSIQSLRELLTEEGEYASTADIAADPDAASKRGIAYYKQALDTLATVFAAEMNQLNDVNKTTHVEGAGALFSNGNGDDTTGITAANISISESWATEKVSMISSQNPDAASDDRSNLAAFLNLFNKTLTFKPTYINGDAVGASYNGTFEDMLLHIESTLAEDQMSTTAVLNSYSATYNEIYTDRDSVMGVDLNDEATNLMVYQKAYTAACRLMTVLETALDSLINGTVV